MKNSKPIAKHQEQKGQKIKGKYLRSKHEQEECLLEKKNFGAIF